jgi:uncharacterized protein (DUF2344 family)
MGYLAMAFLADITSGEAIYFDFYEANKTDDFYKPFADVFGRDIDAFYEEFDVFLKLSPEKQLEAPSELQGPQPARAADATE